jgi:hypothetical protein
MWQFTSSYRIDGITGDCDMNIAPDDLPARLGLTDHQEDELTPEEKAALKYIDGSIPGILESLARIEADLGRTGNPAGVLPRLAAIEDKLGIPAP